MKIRIWGCRGSLTTPGKETLRYGGNTTCVEVRMRDGRVIILDAGSGLRNLGNALLSERELSLHMLLTHAHWDHLCGFPFFAPAYVPQCQITLCGGPTAQQSLQRYFKRQMEPPFFPIPFEGLRARLDFGCRCDHPCTGQIAKMIGRPGCYSLLLNHPDGGYGFKLEDEGKTFVFMPDNELGFHHANGPSFDAQVEFCRGADLLFHDAQYTEAEYQRTRGWGHSTYGDALRLATAARVKRLGLFHHDPERTDDDLDRQLEWCRQQLRNANSTLDCFACAEEMVIEL
jgi:phosphoribosyl 1,2-cyclic phosphodiesterase